MGSQHSPEKRAARTPRNGKPRAQAVELQLAIGRHGVGVELGKAVRVACALVTELAVGLPLAKFPVDVSGGVRRFRHTRGVLERLTVELSSAELARYLAPLARGLLGETTPRVFVGARGGGFSIGFADESTARVLAFEALALAVESDLVVTIAHPRGLNLPSPAAALAMRMVQAALGGVAERTGSKFVVRDLPGRLARALLPEAGARAPDASHARVASLVSASDVCILHASRLASAAESSFDAVRAHEACELLVDADEARLAGDWSRARSLDLWALERAPRHAEVCMRIADIDRLVGGRAEAALATLALAESQTHTGFLAGELAAEAQDAARAVASLSRAAEAEVVPELAAGALARAAELTVAHHEALELLDRAVARAPSSARLRLSRMSRRLSSGRVKDARADAEELEALAKGTAAKHEVWKSVGRLWHRLGLEADAHEFFERALRFVPEDPESSAGLGAALIAQGKVARGVALVSRAIEASRANGAVSTRWVLELARALADAMGDKPAAIARVRSVPGDEPEAMVARGLEGRWRAALGDFAGAQVAYASLRDLAATRIDGDPSAASLDVKALLLEAAAFERDVRGDLAGAQAHVATALRLRPHDRDLEAAYREACEALAPMGRSPSVPPPTIAFRTTPPAATPEDDERRAEELMAEFRARPEDDALTDELALVLFRLGRSHELLALLSARMEDASPARRERLLPAQIAALARLEKAAREAGHDGEAQLFRDALTALGGQLLP